MNDSASRKQDMLTSILNGISAMIYVTELETDKILFINDYMKEHFGIEGDVIGRRCYEVLNQGISERCQWCPCHRLDKEPDIEVIWEELNTLTGCNYRNADRYIDWPTGKKVHIQLCVDISDVKKMQKELEINNSLLQAVNESATYLLSADTESYLDDVHQSMKIIGESANVDRVYVWKNHLIDGVLNSTQIYEWVGKADPQQDNKYTVNMPYREALPGLEKLFLEEKCLNGIVSQMPREYQDYFNPQGIFSIIMVPIFISEQFWGFVGFDDCHNERVFTEKEESTLHSVGLLYAHAHHRNEIIRNIRETSDKLLRSNKLLESVTKASAILLDLKIDENIESRIISSMEVIGSSISADRVHIWRMHIVDDDSHFIHEYEWLSETGKTKSEVPKGMITPFVNMPDWKERFLRNEYVGGPFSRLSPEEQEYFRRFDVVSVVIIPLFLEEQLWGLVSVDDCLHERYFSEDELSLLQSLSLMIASTIERHDLYIKDKKSKERMMLMLDTSPLCTQIWDRNLNTIDCNEAGVRLYGFKDKEEYKEQFIKYCSPEFQPDGQRSDRKAVMLVNMAFRDGLCVFDWMHQTPDGKTMIPAEITLVRAKYGDDDVVLGYTHDLREQKKMISKLVEVNEQNEIQLTKLNLMVKSERIGLWDFEIQEVDPFNPTNINIYSDQFRQLVGYTDKKDFPNILSSWADKLHPDDAKAIFDAFVAHLYDKTGNTPFHVEYRMLKKNGEYAFYSAACETVRAKDGTPLRACGSLIDITERKKNEAERLQAHEALKQREAMLTATNKMAEILLSHEDEAFINVMSRGLKPVCEVAGIDRVGVYRLLSDNERYGQIYLWQGKTIPLDDELRILPDTHMLNRWISILGSDECINVNTMDLPGDEADFLRSFGIKSIFAVPIFMRGKSWGAITLEDHTSYRYIEENCIDLLQSAAHLCAGAISRNEMEREIIQLETENEQLYFDGLTGLYNRRYFDEALARVIKTASRTDGLLSLMMIDIDFFKQYNDTYGHMAGDDCLKIVANILATSVLRPDDFVARYGGEEFAVVMPGVDAEGARTVAERMLKNIQKCGIPHKKSDAAKCVTFSIGITTGKVERSHVADDFIKQADMMLYKSKQNGRNRYYFEYV